MAVKGANTFHGVKPMGKLPRGGPTKWGVQRSEARAAERLWQVGLSEAQDGEPRPPPLPFFLWLAVWLGVSLALWCLIVLAIVHSMSGRPEPGGLTEGNPKGGEAVPPVSGL